MRILINFCKKIFQNSYMVRSIVRRELETRYIGSMMGFFWAFLHPIIMTLMYSLIFSHFLKIKIQRLGEGALPPVNFSVWLLAALLPWTLFSETVNRNCYIILGNESLITKAVFPSEILPLTTLLANIVNHLIGLGILFVFMWITGTPTDYMLITLPLYFILLFLFTLGISWMVAALNVYLRDIGQILQALLQIWFFMSPIIYQTKLIPKPFDFYMRINPFYFIVEGYRDAIISDYSHGARWSTPYLFYIVIMCFGTFIAGGLIFRKLKAGFADVL